MEKVIYLYINTKLPMKNNKIKNLAMYIKLHKIVYYKFEKMHFLFIQLIDL